jgi:hypothetical protein
MYIILPLSLSRRENLPVFCRVCVVCVLQCRVWACGRFVRNDIKLELGGLKLMHWLQSIIIIMIIMKSSFNRDNNYCHYVIQIYYHPAGLDVIMVVYHLLYGLLVFFLVWVGGLGWFSGGNQVAGVSKV